MSTIYSEGAPAFLITSGAQRKLTPPPLVVDLDGTLIKTDLLIESVLALVRKQPLYVFLLPLWMALGKAWFKQQVARRVVLDVRVLPGAMNFSTTSKASAPKDDRLFWQPAAIYAWPGRSPII